MIGMQPTGQPEGRKLTDAEKALHARGSKMFRNFDSRRNVLPGEMAPRRQDLWPGVRDFRENTQDVLESTAEYVKQLQVEPSASGAGKQMCQRIPSMLHLQRSLCVRLTACPRPNLCARGPRDVRRTLSSASR